MSNNTLRNNKISKSFQSKTKKEKMERIDKISMANSIPVLQYDLEGNFIKEWNSAKEANLILFGKPKSGDISACCVGRQKTAHGFILKFKL